MKIKIQLSDGQFLKDIFTDRGLRQGCCLSPPLFKVYIVEILRGLKEKFCLGLKPVSYTHLDVYKRQVYWYTADLVGLYVTEATFS